MSKPLRHALAAYLALLITTWLLFVLLVLPIWADWQGVRQQAQQMQAALNARQQKVASAAEMNAGLEQKLVSLALLGEVIIASPEQATHHFQTAVKSVLQKHGGEAKRLTPSRREISSGLFEISLELTFHAEPETIQWMLEDLARSQSKAQIELLSLRKTVLSTSYGNGIANAVLEGRLIVSTLSASAPALPRGIDVNALQPITQDSQDGVLEAVIGPNRLASLFDPSIRLKFIAPDIGDYRVAAITVTEQSRIAVIMDEASGKTFRLREGDFLHAWKVVKIDPAKVRLLAANKAGELKLN